MHAVETFHLERTLDTEGKTTGARVWMDDEEYWIDSKDAVEQLIGGLAQVLKQMRAQEHSGLLVP